MTLPLETLDRITDTAHVANGKPVESFVPTLLMPSSYKLSNIEHLQEFRSRFRGQLRTESIADFCKYTKEHRTEGFDTNGFIDAERMACNAIFNLGDIDEPGHGDDEALLILKPTAAFKAMNQIAGQHLSQTQLAEWMEDWHDYIQVIDANGETMEVAAAVQKIRTITITAKAERTSSENNFGNSRSSMDSIEAAHAEKQPADLQFTTEPYEGLSPRIFTLRLSIRTGEKPTLMPRWVRQEQQEEEMAQEFKQVLQGELAEVATLTVGTFKLSN